MTRKNQNRQENLKLEINRLGLGTIDEDEKTRLFLTETGLYIPDHITYLIPAPIII